MADGSLSCGITSWGVSGVRTGQAWLPTDCERGHLPTLRHNAISAILRGSVSSSLTALIITRVSTNETASKFAIRRVFRIFPPLVAAWRSSSWAEEWVLALRRGRWRHVETGAHERNARELFMTPQVIFVGVAWTLVIEVILY